MALWGLRVRGNVIKQNLAQAFLYNGIAIPVAAASL
jgi:cation transport ATPase